MRNSSLGSPLGFIEGCYFIRLLVWRNLLNSCRLINLLTLTTMTLIKLMFSCSFRWVIQIGNWPFWLSWSWSTHVIFLANLASCTISAYARLFSTFMIWLRLRWVWCTSFLGKLFRCKLLAIRAKSTIFASVGISSIEIYLNICISFLTRFLHGLFLLAWR